VSEEKRLSILLLAPGFSIHSQRFLQMLLDAGHIVTFVDTHNPKPDGAEHYKFIPYPGIFGLECFRYLNKRLFKDWLTAIQLRLIWARVCPDVVHINYVDRRAYTSALAGLHPLVLTCWGADINNLFESENVNREHRYRIIQALSSADHITADTREILERCEALVGRRLRTSLFYFGIDLKKFKPGFREEAQEWRQKLGITPNSKVVLSVRRPVRQMGHHHILNAFARIVADNSFNAVLVITRFLSNSQEYENELKQQSKQLGISERVIWIDGVDYDQLPILYALADLVINFPEHDGLPVSLFEAATCKKPIITAGLAAYKEFLRDGAFTVVPHGNVSRLTEAMKTVLAKSPEDMAAELETNYALVVQLADQQKCVCGMFHIYESLV
jgi:glycosyltransferase involved in cell wall biosynthesis